VAEIDSTNSRMANEDYQHVVGKEAAKVPARDIFILTF